MLFENYSFSSCTFSSKSSRTNSKKRAKKKYVSLLMRIKMKTKIRNRSNAFNINRSKLRQGHHRVIGKGGMGGGGGGGGAKLRGQNFF